MSFSKTYTVPHQISIKIVQSPHKYDIYKRYYSKYTDIDLTEWQDTEVKRILKSSRYIMNWGRGMSKTILLCFLSVFFALLGMKVCYCVPREDELEKPLDYFNCNPFVDHNPYKKGNDKSHTIKKGTWFYVLGKPMIKITNIDDKGFNLSSGRFNVVIYDECALLMYYKMEKELLNKGKGLMRATSYPHLIFASTPLVGSHFYELYKNYPDSNKSHRNFENTKDNFITNTPDKRRQLEEERREAEEMGTLYAWETENLAIPRTANGAAFKNLYYEDISTFPSIIPTHCGFDFHGWQTGHIWVAFYYNPAQSKKDIYIIKEGAETYAKEEDDSAKTIEFLKDPFFRGMILKGEAGNMINDPFAAPARKYGLIGVDITGNKKHNLEANILNYRIHIPYTLGHCIVPNFENDIKYAEWKDFTKFVLHKEQTGTRFRNHYIDAFANALPIYYEAGMYIPNKRVRDVSFEELDRQVHRVLL